MMNEIREFLKILQNGLNRIKENKKRIKKSLLIFIAAFVVTIPLHFKVMEIDLPLSKDNKIDIECWSPYDSFFRIKAGKGVYDFVTLDMDKIHNVRFNFYISEEENRGYKVRLFAIDPFIALKKLDELPLLAVFSEFENSEFYRVDITCPYESINFILKGQEADNVEDDNSIDKKDNKGNIENPGINTKLTEDISNITGV